MCGHKVWVASCDLQALKYLVTIIALSLAEIAFLAGWLRLRAPAVSAGMNSWLVYESCWNRDPIIEIMKFLLSHLNLVARYGRDIVLLGLRNIRVWSSLV